MSEAPENSQQSEAQQQSESGEQSEARQRALDTDLPLEERMKALEEDPPKDLSEWPDDREMRQATFGGGEGDHGYNEGPEQKLGPSDVVHHEGGKTTVAGKEVDPQSVKSDDRIEPAAQVPGQEDQKD